MRYDLIVIGAGPAGATAAAHAARGGMRTLLLEKHVLPRHKTCGGGMPMTVGEALRDFAPDSVVESHVQFMRHTYRFGRPVLASIDRPDDPDPLTLWMVQRPLFDNALAQRAVKAGVELKDGLPVRSVEVDGSSVTVRGEGGFTATATLVIGADGANGITAKAAGLRRDRTLAIALEVEQPHRWGDGHADLRPDVAHLEYGSVPHGYAWVFPKAEHLNIGAGLVHPRGADGRGSPKGVELLRRTVCRYMDSLGVPYDSASLVWHAHPLPIWAGREPLQSADSRILLAGDAAGLVNPLFGDGILHAVKSGVIAGECAVTGSAEQYTDRIHAEVTADFDAARRLAGFFYQWIGLVYAHAIRNRGATPAAARLLAGQMPFGDMGDRAFARVRRIVSRKPQSLQLSTDR